ncbi:hypothetical protein VOLCADRAFT_97072 [Volvox carteri f. nagariensis]|uniref:ARID domain-containing protein n=1 Tax=Volvox carteri f. nagariensis TaxID=3068 RepID=D8UBT9_VOLCA|nr:uncharacterized protein VOLCADRAFT_97072 [Volvox carteri f. nagariensis]EFJ42881.1 hypothetical protein VOLCADRAFT_97072 [Volvox carteri f. nagariensis]|eukprot:XP_002956141.1 hypothetical protein VOLCADRAFT_97072 [Volvox carteri f. nagariensis]
MKPEAANERAKDAQRQKPASNGSGQNSPVTAGAVLAAGRSVQLGRMSHADLMSLAERHNKELGLVGDVMMPTMRGVAEVATVRPPAVHPFTVGGGSRKDEYQAAWKSLSKRTGVPLMSSVEGTQQAAAVAAGTGGRTARPTFATAITAATAAEVPAAANQAAPQPTHVQMYGLGEQPLQQVQFVEALTAWLGVGPIDLPLLAPGAPPLSLRRLFMEVLEAGGSRPGSGPGSGVGAAEAPGGGSGSRAVGDGSGNGGGGGGSSRCVSWEALAGRLQGDETLGDLLQQVYDAFLLPLERRLPRGTRPARVEAWMQEDLRRRVQLRGEDLAPPAEQTWPGASPCHTPASQSQLSPPGSLIAADAMRALRTAAVAAPSLLPGVIVPSGGSKRARASSRGGRRGGKAASSRKRARGTGAAVEAAAEPGRDGTLGGVRGAAGSPTTQATGAMGTKADADGGAGGFGGDGGGGAEGSGGGGGSSLGPELTDPKASALLVVVASLRELRAGPPGCTSTRVPDLRANFMARRGDSGGGAQTPVLGGLEVENGTREGAQPLADGEDASAASRGPGAAAQRGPRQAKRQRQEDPGTAGPSPLPPRHRSGPPIPPSQQQRQQQQQQAERRYDHPGSSSQQAVPLQRRHDSRPKQHGREVPQPSPPPQQEPWEQQQTQRDRDRDREHSRRRGSDDWRRSSPYSQPAPSSHQLQRPAHRTSGSAVPLMSAAATSPYEWRPALPMLRQAHRAPPPPTVPPAVQQHLEEMRRHAQAARSQPYHGGGGGGGSGSYYYERPSPVAERDIGRFEPGPGGFGGVGDWDEMGNGGGGGGWGYGGARDVH